jgi:hypothetical protein
MSDMGVYICDKCNEAYLTKEAKHGHQSKHE